MSVGRPLPEGCENFSDIDGRVSANTSLWGVLQCLLVAVGAALAGGGV